MNVKKPGRSEKKDNPSCVHHWVIDSTDYGRCIKLGCGAERDFSVALALISIDEDTQMGRAIANSAKARRGRPRKVEKNATETTWG